MNGCTKPALPPAPFLTAVAKAPNDAFAVWLRSSDGIRLRAGVLGRGGRGTVFLLQGRTEYLEKYGHAATEFAGRGYGTVAADFRGQGRSERLSSARTLGHVADFADYQLDLRAMVDLATAQDMPRPWFLLGHSMGGAVALRALVEKMEVAGAVFSAPLWGIEMPALLRPVAWGLGWFAHKTKRVGWITPGTSPGRYARGADLLSNVLTSDAEMLDYMRSHLKADTELHLGGPTLIWLFRALTECRALAAAPLPDIPALVFLPENETVVSKKSIADMVARWPGAELVEVPGGRHETMMETRERRDLFYDRSVRFFESKRSRALRTLSP